MRVNEVVWNPWEPQAQAEYALHSPQVLSYEALPATLEKYWRQHGKCEWVPLGVPMSHREYLWLQRYEHTGSPIFQTLLKTLMLLGEGRKPWSQNPDPRTMILLGKIEGQFSLLFPSRWYRGFPGGSVVKNLPANAGDSVLTPGLGRSLEKEMTTHPCILAWRIPMDRGAWWATVHGVTKESDTTHRLNNNILTDEISY